MNCNSCGSEVFGDSVFCDSCGAIVDSAAPPAAPTEHDSSAYEQTQMIPVAEEPAAPPLQPIYQQPAAEPVAPRPPAQPAPPRPAAPSTPTGHPPSPRRPAEPAYVSQPRKSTIPMVGGALLLLGLVVLAFVISGAFNNDPETDTADGTVDESAEPTDSSSNTDTDGESAATSLPGAAAVEIPEGFVLYEGGCFAAAVPETWTITEDNGFRSYGRRTAWSRGGEELFVDTSPLRDATVTGRQAADEQLQNRSTATSGLIEESGRDDMWSYTYTRSGTPSIAIYFVEERGFGIVGSSNESPDAVMDEARAVAASIEVTNPDC